MITHEKMFGTKKLQELTQIPLQTIYSWIYKGMLIPVAYEKYNGRPARRFNQKNLRELLTIKALRGFVSFQCLRKAAVILHEYGHNPFSLGTFLVFDDPENPKTVSIVKVKDGNFIELTGKHAGSMMLPLWNIGVNK
jgi:hypothetical protein